MRSNGHEVYCPTLTGLGERSHLRTLEVGLAIHILDIANVVEFEDPCDITLVGHSYGGMVITGVADKMTGRIAHLVYLDAIFPEVGQSVSGFFGTGFVEGLLRGSETDWLIPVPKDDHPFGITSDADSKWVKRNLVPQPLKTFTEPLQFDPGRVERVHRSYVYCRRPGSLLTPLANRFRDDPSWGYREISTGHDAMITEPLKVAQILVDLSQRV